MDTKSSIKENLIGKTFGNLKVVSFKEVRNKRRYWNCVCKCGSEVEVPTALLNNGKTKSCGCLQIEKVKTLGLGKKEQAVKSLKEALLKVSGCMISEYRSAREDIECKIDNIIISSRPNSFKGQIIPGYIKFREEIENQGDEYIKAINFQPGVGFKFKIKTYDGGEIEYAYSGYRSFCKSRMDLFKLIEERNHKVLSPYESCKEKKILIDFNCGHAPRYVMVGDYKNGVGCNVCSGNSPENAKENFYKLAESRGHEILSEYKNVTEKVLIDFKCTHEPYWISPTGYRAYELKGCPNCYSNSKGEDIICDYLLENKIKFTRQLRLKNNRKYDIYIEKYNLIVEVHGIQHYEDSKKFTKRTLKEEQKNDREKEFYAKKMKYNYMVIDYREHKPSLALERFKKQFNEFISVYK